MTIKRGLIFKQVLILFKPGRHACIKRDRDCKIEIELRNCSRDVGGTELVGLIQDQSVRRRRDGGNGNQCFGSHVTCIQLSSHRILTRFLVTSQSETQGT